MTCQKQPSQRTLGHELAPRNLLEKLLMTDTDARLRDDVHLLGELLGNTIRDQYGEAFLAKIERIRRGPRMTGAVPRARS